MSLLLGRCTASGTLGPSATVALARRRGQPLEWLLLGDATVLLDSGDDMLHVSDGRLRDIAGHVRARIPARLRAGGGYEAEEHRRMVARLVAAERAARNTPDGYWIAADDPAAASQAVIGTAQIGSDLARSAGSPCSPTGPNAPSGCSACTAAGASCSTP